MKIAVIPIWGRLPLVPHTIKQALRVVDKVIVVASRGAEKYDVTGASESVRVPRNAMLGEKWNAGFYAAKKYDPDQILFIGSSDWVSDNWMDVMLPYSEDYDIVGVSGFHLLHLDYDILNKVSELKIKAALSGTHTVDVKYRGMSLRLWGGYDNDRKGQSIGIGRVLNRRFLKRIDYKPFGDLSRQGMDWNMFNLAESHKVVNDDNIKCLSISTSLWTNLHEFDEGGVIKDENFLDKWFPDTRNLTGWTEAELSNTEIRYGMYQMPTNVRYR